MRIDNVTPGCKEQNDDYMNENSFEGYILSSFYNDEFKKENMMIENVLSLNERSTDNLSSKEKVQEKEKSFGGLVLKEFPKHMNYAFLSDERSKPVIIAENLTTKK